MIKRLAVALGAAALLAGSAVARQAQPTGPADGNWRQAALGDLDAAYALLRDNHPGAVAALGDPAFVKALEAGYADARALAPRVETREGYVAVLRRFAISLGDKHVQARPLMGGAPNIAWPGFLTRLVGDRWVVTGQVPALEGATLISCDGTPVETLAAERIGRYYAVWRIDAQRRVNAWRLLLDTANPFLSRPRACRFRTAAGEVEQTLDWRPAAPAEVQAVANRTIGLGRPGFGLRQVGQGWWISLGSLDDRAAPVVEVVRARAAELRTAPFVVLDLRGNSGGSSVFGDQIAQALYGPAHVRRAAGGQRRDGCETRWRATRGNLASVREFLEKSAPARGPATVAQYKAEAAAIEAAMASGQAFHRPLPAGCPGPAAAERRADAPKDLKARVAVLTDAACFSSCLLVVQEFRSLGALQLGQPTDAGTRYMEIRFETLPSGLAAFSTLQKVDTGSQPEIGPFTPDRTWDGDMADTVALEAWVPQALGLRL